VLHRGGIDAAVGQVHRDAAEDLDSRHDLPDQIGLGGGRLIVALEDDRAQPVGRRDPSGLERIHRALGGIRVSVHVDVDRPIERPPDVVAMLTTEGTRHLEVARVVAAARTRYLEGLSGAWD
jgi:hypothetical protein